MTLSPNNDTDHFACSYSGETGSLSKLRGDVGAFLAAFDGRFDLTDRVLLALTELATNAIEAAAGHPYTVTVAVSDTALTATVSNVRPLLRPHSTPAQSSRQMQNAGQRAEGIPPRSEWGPEETLTPRGRGLLLVEALADSLDIANGETNTTATVILQR